MHAAEMQVQGHDTFSLLAQISYSTNQLLECLSHRYPTWILDCIQPIKGSRRLSSYLLFLISHEPTSQKVHIFVETLGVSYLCFCAATTFYKFSSFHVTV